MILSDIEILNLKNEIGENKFLDFVIDNIIEVKESERKELLEGNIALLPFCKIEEDECPVIFNKIKTELKSFVELFDSLEDDSDMLDFLNELDSNESVDKIINTEKEISVTEILDSLKDGSSILGMFNEMGLDKSDAGVESKNNKMIVMITCISITLSLINEYFESYKSPSNLLTLMTIFG